jgi:predicted O-methyltransferase YrrM
VSGLPEPAALRRHAESLYASGQAPAERGDPISLSPTAIPSEVAIPLGELAAAEGVRSSLEVGLGLGVASLLLAAAVIENAGEQARHVTIDPLQDESWRGAGRRTLRDAGAAEFCELIEEESQLVLPRLVAESHGRFELALIDGDHRFEGAFVDMYFADRLLEPGGLMVADDLWMPAIASAVSYLETNLGYEPIEGLPRPLSSRHSRNPLRRRARVGRVVVLRKPEPPPERGYDAFAPFVAG